MKPRDAPRWAADVDRDHSPVSACRDILTAEFFEQRQQLRHQSSGEVGADVQPAGR